MRTAGVPDHASGPLCGPCAVKLEVLRDRAILDWRTAGRGSKLFSVACVQAVMVAIAQLVEHRVVVAGAAGSSPVSHPIVKCRDIVHSMSRHFCCLEGRVSGYWGSRDRTFISLPPRSRMSAFHPLPDPACPHAPRMSANRPNLSTSWAGLHSFGALSEAQGRVACFASLTGLMQRGMRSWTCGWAGPAVVEGPMLRRRRGWTCG